MHSNKIATTLAVLLTSLFPFVPLAAHAEYGATLTGNAGIGISGSSSSASATADESASATLETEPIVITRAAAEASLATSGSTTSASTSGSLREHANAILSEDSRASAVVLSHDAVSLSYREPAKLFGFIRVDVPVEISADASGKVKINYPWYSFLLSTDRTSLMIRAQAAVSSELASDTSASGALSATEKANLLDSLHEVMRSEASGSLSTRAASE